MRHYENARIEGVPILVAMRTPAEMNNASSLVGCLLHVPSRNTKEAASPQKCRSCRCSLICLNRNCVLKKVPAGS